MLPISDLATSLQRFRVASPEATRALERSLACHGQLCPLAVYRGSDGVEVVDGFKRLGAARKVGLGELSVRVLPVDLRGAKVALATLNGCTGLNVLEEAWLVRTLYRDERLDQPHIGRLFQRDKSWVSRRLALAENLQPDVEADVRLGLVAPSIARALARLPRGNQLGVAAAVQQGGLTAHQTHRLVAMLLKSPETPLADAVERATSSGRRRVRDPPAELAHLARRAAALTAELRRYRQGSSAVPPAGDLRSALTDLAAEIAAHWRHDEEPTNVDHS